MNTVPKYNARSRIGILPIPLPQGVECVTQSDVVCVKGPKGTVTIEWPKSLELTVKDNVAYVLPKQDDTSSIWGTMRSRLNSVVHGVSTGWTLKINIKGVGYKAQKIQTGVLFSLGKSHEEFVAFEEHVKSFPTCIPSEIRKKNLPVYLVGTFPSGVSVDSNKESTQLTLSGADRAVLGNIGHKLKQLRRRNPYKGAGISAEHDILITKQGKRKK